MFKLILVNIFIYKYLQNNSYEKRIKIICGTIYLLINNIILISVATDRFYIYIIFKKSSLKLLKFVTYEKIKQI